MALRPTASAVRNISLLRHAPRSTTTQLSTRGARYHSGTSSSVSPDELTHFSSLASSWWDPLGPSRILHLMNPLRHEFIASCLTESKPRSTSSHNSVSDNSASSNAQTNITTQPGLRYLDIGCGGGIFAESLARTIPPQPQHQQQSTAVSPDLSPITQASSILAIDPSPTMIKIATSHARADPLVHSHLQSGRFKYENTTLEALASPSPSSSETTTSTPQKFDIITLFEVLEHVDPHTSSPPSFLKQCLQLLQPGGWLIGSTIARSLPSYIVNQVIAEAPWPIGVVPRGTHEWGKFVNGDEVRGWVGKGLREIDGDVVYRSGESEGEGGMRWKCVGAMYFPGLGWKMVPGSEAWGNYFWAVQRGDRC
ncbi:3-demethylubiquinone-9 3-O-methyltransferase [Helicocarpus griseus UAMH5409]|uniref:Ubiquinone biosynthesis O-methyltransferase, mitochondrial n=1 Tax=Helicocarpus griseus UAMH5409 TaxID=1447875 RepID=A0A2B7XRM8_9EURO|nr:3-demethylubiquinone-9 3-O-methyltransferase [Helicocarpus griseus UAMH5409]